MTVRGKRSISLLLVMVMLLGFVAPVANNVAQAGADYENTLDLTKIEKGGNSYSEHEFTLDGYDLIFKGTRLDQVAPTFGISKNNKQSSLEFTLEDGLSSMEIEISRAFTGKGDRILGVYVNDILVAKSPNIKNLAEKNGESLKFNFEHVNVKGSAKIRLEYPDYSGNLGQISIHTIAWNNFDENKEVTDLESLTPEEPTEPEVVEVKNIAGFRNLENGQKATIEGTVTQVVGQTVFMEDGSAGIAVYNKNSMDLKPGDKIKVTGARGTHYDLVQIQPENNNDIEVLKRGLEVTPKEVKITEVTAEMESQYLKVTDVEIKSVDEYKVYSTQNKNIFTRIEDSKNELEVDKTYDSITGVLHYEFNQHRILAKDNKNIIYDGEILPEPEKPAPSENITPINEIQGEGHISPKRGNTLTTRGVVTAVNEDSYNKGFYIQSLKTDEDDNPATSEGLFVRTGSNRSGEYADKKLVGEIVEVTGEVREQHFSNWDNELTTTEINIEGNKGSYTEISKESFKEDDYKIEAKIIKFEDIPKDIYKTDSGSAKITQNKLDIENNALDFYEAHENMLVKIEDPYILLAAEQYGDITVVPERGEGLTNLRTNNGGVLFRYESPVSQRLVISDKIIPISANKKWTDANFNPKPTDVFDGEVEGILGYSFGNYKLINTEKLPEIIPGGLEPDSPKIKVDKNRLSAGVYNIENFSIGNPGDKERAKGIAADIVNKLQNPDIIGLVEVQDDSGANDDGVLTSEKSVAAITDAIKDQSGVEYGYMNVDPAPGNQDGGQPGGNIRNVILFRTDRLEAVDAEGIKVEGSHKEDAKLETTKDGQVKLKSNPSRIDQANKAFTSSRKPLIGQLKMKFGSEETVFVINNHFGSKRGDTPLFGDTQPQIRGSEGKRHEQAESVRSFMDEIFSKDEKANIILMGDFNDYEFSKTLEILKGNGIGRLTNLIEVLPEEERHTYVFEGHSQVLDHILVSQNLTKGLTQDHVDILNINSEFSEKDGRVSDHDPLVGQFIVGDYPLTPLEPALTSHSVELDLESDSLARVEVALYKNGEKVEGSEVELDKDNSSHTYSELKVQEDLSSEELNEYEVRLESELSEEDYIVLQASSANKTFIKIRDIVKPVEEIYPVELTFDKLTVKFDSDTFEGGLPKISIVTKDLNKEKVKSLAYDITFTIDGKEVQPKEGKLVELIFDIKDFDKEKVFAFHDTLDNKLVKDQDYTIEGDNLIIQARDFSVYGVAQTIVVEPGKPGGTGNTGDNGAGTGNTGGNGAGTGNTGGNGAGTGNTGGNGAGTGNTGNNKPIIVTPQENNSTSPKTGDDGIVIYLGLALGALAIIVIMAVKKKGNKEA